jgi:outer membrane protein assembly factor BamA
MSGNVISLFNRYMPLNEYDEHTIWNTPYSQYIRAELILGKTIHFGEILHQSLALRFLAGAGYGYGNSTSAPLDKLFYCGGSTSMRGWQARTLGPGTNTLLSDIFVIPTQLADMKLEANMEYRFPLAWKFEGALFLDAGNIWDIPGSDEDDEEINEILDSRGAQFSIKSIAMNWGLGLRLNLDFILLRLDAGIRIHDPGREEGHRWVAPANWLDKGNAAIHFGVGYPF